MKQFSSHFDILSFIWTLFIPLNFASTSTISFNNQTKNSRIKFFHNSPHDLASLLNKKTPIELDPNLYNVSSKEFPITSTHYMVQPLSFSHHPNKGDLNLSHFNDDEMSTTLCDLSLDVLYIKNLNNSFDTVTKNFPSFLSVVDSQLKALYVESSFGVGSFRSKLNESFGVSTDFCFKLDFEMNSNLFSEALGQFNSISNDQLSNAGNSNVNGFQLSTPDNQNATKISQQVRNNATISNYAMDVSNAVGLSSNRPFEENLFDVGKPLPSDNHLGAMFRASIAGSYTMANSLSEQDYPILRLLLLPTDASLQLDSDTSRTMQQKRQRIKTSEEKRTNNQFDLSTLSDAWPFLPFESVLTRNAVRRNANLGCETSDYPNVHQLKSVLDMHAMRPIVMLNPMEFPRRELEPPSIKQVGLQSNSDMLLNDRKLLTNEEEINYIMATNADGNLVSDVINSIANAVRKFGRKACFEAPAPAGGRLNGVSPELVETRKEGPRTRFSIGIKESKDFRESDKGIKTTLSTIGPRNELGMTATEKTVALIVESTRWDTPVAWDRAPESEYHNDGERLLSASTTTVTDLSTALSSHALSWPTQQHATTSTPNITSMTFQYIRNTVPLTTTITSYDNDSTTLMSTYPTKAERTPLEFKTKYRLLHTYILKDSKTMFHRNETTTQISNRTINKNLSSTLTTSILIESTTANKSDVGTICLSSVPVVAASLILVAGLFVSFVRYPNQMPVIEGGEPYTPTTELLASRDMAEPITPSAYA